MKRNKKITFSTDYFFEDLYNRTKGFLFSHMPSKLVTLKIIAVISWFKHIN